MSYLDSFYLQNHIHDELQKPLFYVHVNETDLISLGEQAVLEINGSCEPSKLRAKLFLQPDDQLSAEEEVSLKSGDVIRIFHKEAKGFLTVMERNVDLLLPKFPDFLQRQIGRIASDM